MLFRKKVEKACAYCAHAGQASGEHMICVRKGFVPVDGSCRWFRYDPLKRKPSRMQAKDFSRFDEEDFSL